MTEIVVGENILLETSLLVAAHAARLTARVQRVGDGVRPLIEGVVIHRLVDANAPENDGRMIPVLQNHILHIRHRLILPGVPSDVLPAREFREDQKPQFIAAVDERLRLRVV